MRRQRPCITCGQPTFKARCLQHTPGRATGKEQQRRRATVANHVAAYGWWCPGYHTQPHPSRDLTADHLEPRSQTFNNTGELRILCRACNSRRGNGPK